MIKLAAFDLDGTIGDTIPVCIEAFRKAVSPYAGHSLTDKEIQVYEQMHGGCRTPYNGIKEQLRGLRDRGTKTALITGKGEKSCQITLEQFELSDIFDDVTHPYVYSGTKTLDGTLRFR